MDAIKNKLGDSPAGVWLMEVMHDCVHELLDGTPSVDMNLLAKKCRGAPENVPLVLAVLAEDLNKRLDGGDLFKATGITGFWRLMVGAIFLAYCASRGIFQRAISKELDSVVMSNLVIMECVDFLEQEKGIGISDLKVI